MSRIKVTMCLFVAVLVAPKLWAQPLAEHLPKDAILYVGWSGTKNMGPGYGESHLKAMIELSHIERMISEIMPQAFQKLAETVPDDEAKQAADFMSVVGLAMWQHPTAIYFGGVDFDGDDPMPQLALVCDAADDAQEVHTYLANLIDQAGDLDVPVAVKKIGSRVVLTVGKLSGDQQGALGLVQTFAPVPRLTDNKVFKSALEQSIEDPVLVAYVDAQRLLGLIDTAIESEEPDQLAQWSQIREALGLDGVQCGIVAAGFDGKHWGTRGFLKAPAPRSGLLALLDQKAIDEGLLASIPETSTTAAAFNLDLAGLVDLVKDIANKFDPNASTEIDNAFDGAKQMLGFDPMQSLLKPLGGQWAFYIDEQTGSSGPFGSIVVNRLRDAKKFQQTLVRLEAMANAMMAQETQDEDFTLQIKSAEVDGTELHYFATPLVSPAWAVRDGNLYLGLQPQFVAGAAHNVASGRKSIADNPQFAKLRDQLGAKQFGSFRYTDLPRMAPDGYSLATAISRTFVGLADMAGVEDVPPMLLPPMYKLKPHLTPSASFSWSDEKGYYVRSVEAFPGSSIFSIGTTGVAAWLMTSALPAALISAGSEAVFEEAIDIVD